MIDNQLYTKTMKTKINVIVHKFQTWQVSNVLYNANQN